jgi:PGF-pre-PGF domain-containing protein
MDENTIEMFVNETKVTPNIIPITDGYVVVYEPSAEFPDLEEVEVSVHAEDKVGNILIYNWSFIISLSSPIPLNETPADGSYANATPMIGVNIEDEDGINKTSISMFVDGRPVYLEITNTSIYKYQVKNQTFIPFDDGKEVKVRLEVQDLNNSKLIYIWFFTIDALPPNASAEVPANGTYINQSSPVIGVNIVDRGSGVDKNTMKMVVGGEERIAEIIAIENGYRVTYTPVTTHFEDGEVNVNIAVSDKIGNAMSYWWSFMIDTLAPTASDVSPADGSVISTTKPTISIFLRDEMSGVDEDSIVMLIGKTDLSASLSKIPTEDGYRIYFTPDVGFADGVINVTVYVKDNASNQMTLTWSFRIDTSQSPLLPPSGGGGGGYIISVSSDNILDEIHAPSLEIKSIIRSFPTQITKIEILAKGEVKVEVEEIGRPENVEKPEGISYRYFQISASGEIKGAKIEFKVEKSWISENEIDESTIKLYKYSEGWVELPTSKSGEDENFSYFKSTAHGFSIFVIVGKKKVQEKKVWKEELKKEEIEKEGSKLKPNPILFSAVALVIVSLTIFIRRRNRKHRPLKELGDELEKLSSKLDEITEVE